MISDEESEKSMRIIRNYDVGSYYPHLITINGYASRNMKDPEIFSRTLERRMVAKKAGDKTTANALKLIVNTAFGATKNGVGDTAYNALYDPLMARSICISGQLYLIELANHMIADIPDLKIVQLNTDGIMVEFDEQYYPKVLEITKEWQERTGFTLEEDQIAHLYQKDVNNYIEVAMNGSFKLKGGYLVRGVSTAGAFKINNDANIVATAIVEYFVHGKQPADVIMACDDIKQFQLIAKGSGKYSRVYQQIDGVEVTQQRVNRVYASKDKRNGTLYKIKAENGQVSKIAGLPEHCIIDNDNHLTIDDVDKIWYVAFAQQRINDFLGVKNDIKKERKTKSMATAKSLNVFARLAAAREEFMNSDIEKSGKNFHLKTQYWELKDIVPTAMTVMHKNGIIPIVSFDSTYGHMTVVNVDNPEDRIDFTLPLRELTGNQAINPVQSMGAVETYYRRYLYLACLEICEADEIEPHLSKPETAEKIEEKRTGDPAQPVKPAENAPKAVNREEIKQNLTAVEGAADAIQIDQLKEKLGLLAKSGNPDWINLCKGIIARTENLTKLNRKSAEAIIRQVTSILEAK